MKYKKMEQLSNHISDLVKFRFNSKSASVLNLDIHLSIKVLELQGIYESCIFNDYESKIDSTHKEYENAKKLQLSRWHVDASIQAVYASNESPLQTNIWNLMYIVTVADLTLSYQCAIDSYGVYNKHMGVMISPDKSLTLDLMDYFTKNSSAIFH